MNYTNYLIADTGIDKRFRPEQLPEVIQQWDVLDRIAEHSYVPMNALEKLDKLKSKDLHNYPYINLAIELFELHRDFKIIHPVWSIYTVGEDQRYLEIIPQLFELNQYELVETIIQELEQLRTTYPWYLFSDLARLCTIAAVLTINVDLKSMFPESYNFRLEKYAKSLNTKSSKFKTEFPYIEPYAAPKHEFIDINHSFMTMSHICTSMYKSISEKNYPNLITKSYELIDYANGIFEDIGQCIYFNLRFFDNLAFSIEQAKQNEPLKFMQIELKELNKLLSDADENHMLDEQVKGVILQVYRVAYLIIDYFFKEQ